MKNYEKFFCFVIISFIFFLSFNNLSFGENNPNNLIEVSNLNKTLNSVLEVLRKAWQKFLYFIFKIFNFIKDIFINNIFPFLKDVWQKTFGQEIKERKSIIKEELNKEKEEFEEEIKIDNPLGNGVKSFWQKIKGIIK